MSSGRLNKSKWVVYTSGFLSGTTCALWHACKPAEKASSIDYAETLYDWVNLAAWCKLHVDIPNRPVLACARLGKLTQSGNVASMCWWYKAARPHKTVLLVLWTEAWSAWAEYCGFSGSVDQYLDWCLRDKPHILSVSFSRLLPGLSWHRGVMWTPPPSGTEIISDSWTQLIGPQASSTKVNTSAQLSDNQTVLLAAATHSFKCKRCNLFHFASLNAFLKIG